MSKKEKTSDFIVEYEIKKRFQTSATKDQKFSFKYENTTEKALRDKFRTERIYNKMKILKIIPT